MTSQLASQNEGNHTTYVANRHRYNNNMSIMTKKGICMYGNYQEGEFRNRQKEIHAYLI